MKVYKYTSEQVTEYAKRVSHRVVYRRYENGDPIDEKRLSGKIEKTMIQSAIDAALTAIKAGYEERACIAMAEYFIIELLSVDDVGHINTFDSICVPINDFLERSLHNE